MIFNKIKFSNVKRQNCKLKTKIKIKISNNYKNFLKINLNLKKF